MSKASNRACTTTGCLGTTRCEIAAAHIKTEGVNNVEGVFASLVMYRSLLPPAPAVHRLCVVRAPWASPRVRKPTRVVSRLMLRVLTPSLI